MAQITFNPNPPQSTNSQNSVGFFSLKNNGDEAIVRFEQPDFASFDILSVHSISLNGRFRNVNCLRDVNQNVDACPLCKNGTEVRQRIFVKLIQYTKQPDGTVLAEPKVWERPMSFAYTLKSYQENYGNLADIVCKIVRHGEARSMQTRYEIIPNLSKQIYTDELYPDNPTAFENYKALGRIVMNKNFDDLNVFAATGNFPAVEEQPIPNPGYSNQNPNWESSNNAVSEPAPWEAPESAPWAAPTPQPTQAQPNAWGQQQAVNRPVRNTY